MSKGGKGRPYEKGDEQVGKGRLMVKLEDEQIGMGPLAKWWGRGRQCG